MKIIYFALCIAILSMVLSEVRCDLEVEIVHEGKVISRRDGHGEITDLSERKAVISYFNWPDKIVPYVLDDSVTEEDPCEDRFTECPYYADYGYCTSDPEFYEYSCYKSCGKCGSGANMGKRIRKAMDVMETFTCLNFREKRSSDSHYVRFKNNGGHTGCWSDSLGKKGGEQTVNIAENTNYGTSYSGCDFHYTILHEIGHAIGLYHEQMRTDRDDYLTIHWENIPTNMRSQFEKAESHLIDNYDVPYDYLSIMQYTQYAFGSPPGSVTMEANDEFYQDKMGYVKTLSMRDIEILNKMYECPTAYYRIRHIATNKVLDSWNGIVLYSQDGTDYQEWSFDGKHIRNRHFPGTVLTMTKDTYGSGWVDVSMEDPRDGDKTQEWEHVAQGLYNEWDHKMYALAVEESSVACYSTLDENDSSQQWKFEKIE